MVSNWQIRNAARYLRAGGVIAHPTEAVFGLACDPDNPAAVQHLLDLKKRPVSKGLILIAQHFDQLAPYLQPVPETLWKRLCNSWPGPVTWILPVADHTPTWLTGSHRSLAVRVTSHALTSRLCGQFGGALVSTSANLTGHPPPTNQLGVRIQLANQVRILNGATDGRSQPSAIYDGLSLQRLR